MSLLFLYLKFDFFLTPPPLFAQCHSSLLVYTVFAYIDQSPHVYHHQLQPITNNAPLKMHTIAIDILFGVYIYITNLAQMHVNGNTYIFICI